MFFSVKGYWQGVFFLMLMMAVSSINDVIMKLMGNRIDSMVVCFFRCFFGLITLIPFIMRKGQSVFHSKKMTLNITRGVLGAISFSLYIYSLVKLPIVEIVAIMWSIPLFVLLLSIFFLKETVSKTRYIATICGFIGLFFLTIYDGSTSFSFKIVYMLPISAAFLFAAQDVIIKKMVDNESRTTMLFYFFIITTFTMLIPAIAVWKTPSLYELFMLFILGAGGNLMQFLIFKAYSATDLSALSPYRYTEIIFGAMFGYIFFREVPGINVIIGSIILIISTMYIGYSEHKKSRKKLENLAA